MELVIGILTIITSVIVCEEYIERKIIDFKKKYI
jgi:hypothetical protein